MCVAVASNVTGIISDYETISKICRKYGAYLCLDAATSSPYMNVPSYLFDAMFISPHKAIGGPGTVGLLVVRKSLIDTSLPPTFAGGGTVTYVNDQEQYYDTDIHNLRKCRCIQEGWNCCSNTSCFISWTCNCWNRVYSRDNSCTALSAGGHAHRHQGAARTRAWWLLLRVDMSRHDYLNVWLLFSRRRNHPSSCGGQQ